MKKELTKNIDILRLNLRFACEEFNRVTGMNMWGLDREGNIWWCGQTNPILLLTQIEQIKQEIKELEAKNESNTNS